VSAGDGGSLTVKVTGKNLLYLPDIEERTVGGVTYSVKNGVIKIKGTSTGSAVWLSQGEIKLFAGTWLFNPNPVKGTESSNCYLDVTNNVNRDFSLMSKTNDEPVKLTELQAKYKFSVSIRSTAGSVIDMEWKPQMLLSDKLLPYSPYREQLLTLPTPNGLPGIPVTSGGNYTDSTGQQWICDEVDLERGVKVQRIDKGKVLSSYSIHATGIEIDRYWFPHKFLSKNLDSTKPILSNYFTQKTNGEAIGGLTLTSGAIGMAFGLKGTTTVEDFKKFVDLNDVYIWYALATPIEKPLTPAELSAYKALATYGPDTVVQAGDGAGVKLEYQRDVNIAIKKLEDAIASMT